MSVSPATAAAGSATGFCFTLGALGFFSVAVPPAGAALGFFAAVPIAYLVMVVVGHLIVPAVLAVETAYSPPDWLQLLIWLPLTLVASLGLLQPTKGAVVGLQWQLGMHGFEAAGQRRQEQLAITASTASAPA